MVSNESDRYIVRLVTIQHKHSYGFEDFFNLIGKHILLQKVNGNAYFYD